MNIYQQIWDADQTGSGIKPILAGTGGDPAHGYVKVSPEASGDANTKVLAEVVIPASKSRTYDLVRALFDNYALDERDPENETAHEREEVHNLLAAVVDTAPMQVARRYVEEATDTVISLERWYGTLLDQWFRRFSQSGDPDLSGFEHVFVGEQEGAKVQGYHFWYKYYLDDGLASQIDRNRLPGFRDDRIVYLRGKYGDGQEAFPESVTISYRWDAADYDRGKIRPLTKPTGGFFVGCSVEGLMAMGAVRAHLGARAPKEAVINGARYDLKVFRSTNNQHIRTFYPMFLGPAGEVPEGGEPTGGSSPTFVEGTVRIIAALVNPVGEDEDQETVTLINTGSTPTSLEGWALLDAANHRYVLPGMAAPLGAGLTTLVRLPRNSIQLSNKGGEIHLLNRDGSVVHRVSYTKGQAEEQGRTLTF
ncbi:lamin tail domain-containing protein [Azotobacter beijerinckii]|uniref:Lamin Tail Domain n=1 Tax=Azotobacter beijerinckii TaxID=170623 RepID=A0A1I4D3I4_9GAMM|nr:lamin tail domain-containing protein [Azotobacter beijerinckii]SFB28568.1 Lamin Tail Domain [Azotobacter beijerinckii]SFK86746.1 Lamin Tail Domain [Azotobacter beijerinckii]